MIKCGTGKKIYVIHTASGSRTMSTITIKHSNKNVEIVNREREESLKY